MIHTILDIIGIIGIAMLAFGLYLYSAIVMFTVIGALFISFSILSESGTVTIRLRKKADS